MKKIKILFILDHFYPHIGGAETLFWNLCNELSKDKKYELTVATSNSGGITGFKVFKKNFKVFYFKWPIVFGHPIPLYKDLKNLIKETNIIHTATYTSAFFSFFYSKIKNKKIIVTVYENLFLNWFKVENLLKALIFFLFEFFTLKLPFDYYISISKATKKDLEKIFINKEKIAVIYPFLKLNDFRPNLDKKDKLLNKYFLYYGRPGKTKGIFILLEAINILKNKAEIKNFKFKFVLSFDPLKERLNFIKKIKELKLNNLVEVYNPMPKDKLRKMIINSYAVIIPSITEGFGYTTYESITLNKPVIVSDLPVIKEIIGGYYLFFKRGNPKDLADKIIYSIKYGFKKSNLKKILPETECQKLNQVYSSII